MRMRMRRDTVLVDTTDGDDDDEDGRSLKDHHRCWATHTDGNEAM